MQIALGSTSVIKCQALKSVYPDSQVHLVDVVSAVPPQPIGQQQTLDGAMHRAKSARKEKPGCDLYVGIENGMFQRDEDNRWVDAACIVAIRDGDSKEHIFWSDSIEIPDDMEKGPQGEWSILKDPHIVVTKGKRSRAQFLADALSKWQASQ